MQWAVWPRHSGRKNMSMPILNRDSPRVGNRRDSFLRFLSLPRNLVGAEYLRNEIMRTSPDVVVSDCHPVRRKRNVAKTICPWVHQERQTWNWLIDSAMYGGPQSRDREITASAIQSNTITTFLAPLFIYESTLQSVIREFMYHDSESQIIQGRFIISRRNSCDL